MDAFKRVNVTFYDAVSVIRNVITTANRFPYTAKFIFVGARNNKNLANQTLKDNRIRIYCCRI